jgi:hypothetical protein
MKTGNKWFAMALIGIVALSLTALSLNGCTQNDSPPPPEQPVPYGELPNGVKIYKGEGVTDEQMATAVPDIIAGYNEITDSTQIAELNRILTKIVVISSDKNYSWDGHNLGLKYSLINVTSIKGVLGQVANGTLSLTNGEPPETFTVTFHANGGTPEPPNQTVEKGKTASEPAAMTKANSDFEGWYKESGFTTQWIFANGGGVAADTVNADIALYAKWVVAEVPEPASYDLDIKGLKLTVNYQKKPSDPVPPHLGKIDNAVAGFNASTGPASIDAGEGLTARGGDFVINVEYGDESYNYFVAVDGRTLKVHDSWLSNGETNVSTARLRAGLYDMLELPDPLSRPTFTVTFHANGGTPEPPNQTVEKGKTASEPAAMTKANSDFEGWYKESALTTKWIFASGGGVAADTVSADIALYAKWVVADTAFRLYEDVVMFTDSANDDKPYYADIKDARTGVREKSLEQILDANNKNIVERLQNAVDGAFNSGTGISGAQVKVRFRNVFNPEVNTKDKVIITIENGVTYASYKVDDSANILFSFDYLSTVSDADLQAAITTAVRSMNDEIG